MIILINEYDRVLYQLAEASLTMEGGEYTFSRIAKHACFFAHTLDRLRFLGYTDDMFRSDNMNLFRRKIAGWLFGDRKKYMVLVDFLKGYDKVVL